METRGEIEHMQSMTRARMRERLARKGAKASQAGKIFEKKNGSRRLIEWESQQKLCRTIARLVIFFWNGKREGIG
jgi:hypothetical protein